MLPEQEGAYFRLLCFQWNSEDQTVPGDDDSLACMSRLGDRWGKLGDKVRACFLAVEDAPGRLRNERLYHEYERIMGLRAKQAAGGKEGMSNRWKDKPRKPKTKPPKKPKPPVSATDRQDAQDQFERCWTKFGKYGVKKKALAYWAQIKAEDRDKIEAAIPKYDVAVQNGRLKKQFEGWINPANRLWDMDWDLAASVAREKNGVPVVDEAALAARAGMDVETYRRKRREGKI